MQKLVKAIFDPSGDAAGMIDRFKIDLRDSIRPGPWTTFLVAGAVGDEINLGSEE